MKPMQPYSYTVLQYHHDVWTGEALNIGVLMYAPRSRYVKFIGRTGRGRILQAFPNLDTAALRMVVHSLERHASSMASDEGMLLLGKTARDIGTSMLSDDDSSLQWHLNGSGISSKDCETIGAELFERFVTRYDNTQSGRDARTDEMVFETVKRKLERAELYSLLEPHTVQSEFSSMTFDHAFKNGVWHCIQPLSLDSADEDRMLTKAATLAGKFQSILSNRNVMKAYIVTGPPVDQALLPQYVKMMKFLKNSPLAADVIDERESERMVDILASLSKH